MATGGHMHNLTTLIKRYVGLNLDFMALDYVPGYFASHLSTAPVYVPSHG